jgi:hypothetical protein
MIDTKKKTIDGAEYSVTQFPARRGLALKIKLVKLIGPALAEAAGGLDLKEGVNLQEAEIDTGFMGKAVEKLVEGMDDSTGDLILDLLSMTRKNGQELKEAVFDTEFAGDYLTLYKVLGFVIQVNGFFGKGGIGMLTAAVMPKTEKPAETKDTSGSD